MTQRRVLKRGRQQIVLASACVVRWFGAVNDRLEKYLFLVRIDELAGGKAALRFDDSLRRESERTDLRGSRALRPDIERHRPSYALSGSHGNCTEWHSETSGYAQYGRSLPIAKHTNVTRDQMSVLGWMTAVGGLLLLMALTSSQVGRLPISTSLIYLLVGLGLGPVGLELLRLDIEAQREWLETLTEFAVIVSLFVGGLRLRLPFQNKAWRVALRLAGPVMLLSILGVAAAANLLLGLPVGVALLLGAIVAPTDPVLAAEVSVNDAEDHDRVRYGLSGEAGLNDGAAFPFVIFALMYMRLGGVDAWVGEWFLTRIVWAVPVGLAIGYFLGTGLGQLAIRTNARSTDASAPNDFLALALIALAYVAAERAHAYGFLAVFAAGVGLRHAEVRVVRASPHPELAQLPAPDGRGVEAHPPAETLVMARVSAEQSQEPAVAAGVLIAEALSFGDTLERLLEVLLVVLVGIAVATVWTWSGALLAVLLFVVIRPAGTWLSLVGSRTSRAQRWLLGWFGIRGIGSLYYLSYALNHGVTGSDAAPLVGLVVSVVACSIVIHGISVTPALQWYERSLARRD